MKKIFIVVNVQKEGFHRWPTAPKEVDFLKHRHRHIFHIRAVKAVKHTDRDIEIITFKNKIETWMMHEWGWMSCEMIAEACLRKYDLEECEVTEDGENGAIIKKFS